MKRKIRLSIVSGLLMAGILFSCKKQDGYSDEIQTDPNPGTSAAQTVTDTTGTTNKEAGSGSLGEDTQPAGAQSTGSQSVNSGDANSGNTGSAMNTAGSAKTSGNNNVKSTGTGSGPGPSAKDGAAYTPSSDPKQNPKRDTLKKGSKSQK